MKEIRLLRADEIDCRVAQCKSTGVQLLLYKDARCDMAILDETFGPMNWQRHHSRDNANCIVSIWDESKKQWIDKEDTGTESNTEAEKGLASDSFKRACVNVGVGRELYTSPFIWVLSANCEIKKSDSGRLYCNDRFAVQEIGYNDRREINRLVIVNTKTKNVVFQHGAPRSSGGVEATENPSDGKGRRSAASTTKTAGKGNSGGEKPIENRQAATEEQKAYIRENASDAAYESLMTQYGAELESMSANDAAAAIAMIELQNTKTELDVPTCERCQKIITGIVTPDKNMMSASELIGRSKLTYGGIYCYECMKELKAKKVG